ncbi:ABC transporter substrate-binding protein [Paenibacillus agaridevorans]|uniref:ABC transporter substrate-binding protein n=1 Tax=Paenibacillus agaridevorans TaxID=171404 RepID=UPI001BE3E448|nr:sugar ABC transporter substrate-binding protein [Paenibacillus agaridevorans]
MKAKKAICTTVSLIVLATAAVGCAGTKEPNASKNVNQGTDNNNAAVDNDGAANTGDKVKVKFAGWGDPSEKQVFDQLIKDFETKNPTIDVEYMHMPADYVGKMNTMLAGGTAPDVLYVPDGDFGRWVSAGLLMPIDNYVESSNIDIGDMWESGLKRYKYDGKKTGEGELYALPKDIGPIVLYYNKELFDAAGVPYPSAENPMTFDELLETAKLLTKDETGDGKPEQYGMGPAWWEGWIWGNGGKILSDDRKEFMMHEKAATDALQFAADLRNKHGVSPDTRALQAMNDGQMFETGKLAMMQQGRWMVPTYRKLDFDWDVAPNPTNGQWDGHSGSVGLGIYSKTANADAAFKLVEYLGGPEGQKLQSEMGFAIPSFKSMANSDVFLQPGQKPEHAEVFVKAAEVQKPGPWTNLPNAKWWDTLNQNLAQVWDGRKTAEALMNELKPEIDKLIKEGNPKLFE